MTPDYSETATTSKLLSLILTFSPKSKVYEGVSVESA